MAGTKKEIYNRSLERALQILCAFSFEKRALSLRELSQNLNLSKSTVYRLCSTLLKYGFLISNESSNKYSLGLRLFELGGVVFSSFSMRETASKHLTQLQADTGETVFLGILQDDELMYIDKIEATESPIRFRSEIGMRRQPYFGMLGQTLLAFLPERDVDRMLKKNPIKPMTNRSLRTRKALQDRFEEIRNQGFAFEKGEVIDGVVGIAAPVRNYTNKVVAALGVRFILANEEREREKKFINKVCEAAQNISQDLGYHNNSRI